jgi:hypothetical protein
VVLLVVGSVFGEHAIIMLNFIVRGAGNWLLQNTSVTRKTAWCYHRWDTHCSEPQISLHALCTSVMSLSVRKHKTSAGKITLLSRSPFKHWTTDAGVSEVSVQFMNFLFVSSVHWVCPESCKACGFQGKHKWLVGCASYTSPDLNTFDSYLLVGGGGL